jgi:hypothetical protein
MNHILTENGIYRKNGYVIVFLLMSRIKNVEHCAQKDNLSSSDISALIQELNISSVELNKIKNSKKFRKSLDNPKKSLTFMT